MVKKQMAKAESSATPKPKFEEPNYSLKNADISELQSMKNQVIEDLYSTDNENHKKIFVRMIDEIEQYQYTIARDHYWTNGSMPDEPIIFFKPEPEIHNQDSLKINIDEWSDLEIRIGIDKVTFRKISSNSTRDMLLSTLNWDSKNIKMDVIRILANGNLRTSDFIVYNQETAKVNKYETPNAQSIKNAISGLRQNLYRLFPSLKGVDPIEYSTKDKQWHTSIKITITDGEEKRVETEIKYKYGLGYQGNVEETYNPVFRDPTDTYQDNRSSIQDKFSKYLPDDEQEDDNGY